MDNMVWVIIGMIAIALGWGMILYGIISEVAQ